MQKYLLSEMLLWSLEKKIDHALGNIDQFYHAFNGGCYGGFSGGKDSVLLKYLLDKFTDMCGYPRLPMVFNNTTNEHQEILDFVKSFGDEIIWLKPKMTFAQSLLINGYPLVSKEQAQFISEAKNTKSEKLRDIRMNGVKKVAKSGTKYNSGKISKKWKFLVKQDIKITHKCCDILKKRPVALFEKETGLHPFVGVTTEESVLRKQQYNKTGSCNSFDGKRPISKPISIFTEANVWDIILTNKLPYCPIYDKQEINGVFVEGEKRTGCAYCGFGVQFDHPENTKFHRLYYREPKRYKSMMDKLGYRDALHLIGIKLPDDPQHGQINMF